MFEDNTLEMGVHELRLSGVLICGSMINIMKVHERDEMLYCTVCE